MCDIQSNTGCITGGYNSMSIYEAFPLHIGDHMPSCRNYEFQRYPRRRSSRGALGSGWGTKSWHWGELSRWFQSQVSTRIQTWKRDVLMNYVNEEDAPKLQLGPYLGFRDCFKAGITSRASVPSQPIVLRIRRLNDGHSATAWWCYTWFAIQIHSWGTWCACSNPETTLNTYQHCLEHLETTLADSFSRSLDMPTWICFIVHLDAKTP